MPKHDALTPKAIANRIKAKGLQKLRWFCQMCQKQCRDENGFKCHLTSESHQRQMGLFAQDPDKFIDHFSEEFEEAFLEVLTRRFGTRRVNANYVYNEYIQDKTHTHMNATMWPTLTDFVKYLGRTGKCTIEETDKGWFIQWINRDPEVVKRQEATARRQQQELDDESRHEAELAAAVEHARAAAAPEALETHYTELKRDVAAGAGGEGKIKVALMPHLGAKPVPASATADGPAVSHEAPGSLPAHSTTDGSGGAANSSDGAVSALLAGQKRRRFDVEADDGRGSSTPAASAASAVRLTAPSGPVMASSVGSSSSAAAMSNMQRLIEEDARLKQTTAAARAGGVSRFDRPAPPHATAGGTAVGTSSSSAHTASSRRDDWVTPGIIVKVLNKRVGGGAYYKAKGAITEVVGTYVAVVRMLDSGDVLKVDQADLETVIPARGGAVMFVNGPYRGAAGELVDIQEDKYTTSVRLNSGGAGAAAGRLVQGVEYEDISKLAAAVVGGQSN